MKRRAKRDLLTLFAIVAVLAGIVGTNVYMRLDTLKEQFAKMRMAREASLEAKGVKLIYWDMLRETKGTRYTGPKFSQELLDMDGDPVNICGFMAAINQFRKVTEFMLLPVPMVCYFCESPPMRDIIKVELIEPGDLVNEPIVVGGFLALHKEPKQPFFTTIGPAKWDEPVDVDALKAQLEELKKSEKEVSEDHKKHLIAGFEILLDPDSGERELMEPMPVPAPASPE